jgi:hypothetical protein
MRNLGDDHNPRDWQLLMDYLKQSLKGIFLHKETILFSLILVDLAERIM